MDQLSPSPHLFVARDAELARMHGFIDQAMDGGGSVCFVTGESGAGKSTLLEEFSRRVLLEYPDLIFASGDCNPQTGTGDPYLPFREIMSALTGAEESRTGKQDAPERSRSFFQAAARMLAEHGPDLIDIFVPGGALVTRVGAQAASRIRSHRKGKTGVTPSHILSADGDLEQTHLFEQYTNVILALAEKQPLILLLDDLHWADEASISLLFHLSRRLSSARVLIIGAYRAHEITLGRAGQRHPLEATLNELKRYFGDIWVDLGDLKADANRQFVDQVLDAQCDGVDEAFRSDLFKRTGGHALFTIELVQFLKHRGYLVQNAQNKWEVSPKLRWDGLPARVEGVISERITRLEHTEHELLTTAAIIGESFSAEILAGILKLELREVIRSLSGPLAKTHALVKAEGFERAAGHRMSMYGFKHNLMHQFFYDSMDEIERGFLHEEAGVVLETFFQGDPEVAAVQLARHFSEAGITDKAVNYLVLAGHQARTAYAHTEALSHCTKALEVLNQSAAGECSPEWVQGVQTEIHTLLGKELELSGEFEVARQHFEQALDATAESDCLSRAGLKREIAITFEREHQHEMALEKLNEAANLITGSDNPDDDREMTEWISIRNNQLWIHYWQGNTDEMKDLIREIGETVVERGTPPQKQRFYAAVAGLENRLNRFVPSHKTMEAFNQALAAAQESGCLSERANAIFFAGFVQIHAGEHATAADLMTQSLELSRRCGDRTQQARCLAYLTIIKRKAGDLQKVDRYLAETLEICAALNMREYVAVVLANRSWIAWKNGKLQDATALAEEALESWQNHSPGYPFKWLALIQLIDIEHSNARLKEALEHIRLLLDPANAKLAGGVEEALQETVACYATCNKEQAVCSLATALEYAKKAGYL